MHVVKMISNRSCESASPAGGRVKACFLLTDEDGSDEIVIKHPTCGDVGYADMMLVADFAEDDE
jgi:hypothetical protein